MIKILVADDHAIVRSGLKQIVDDTPDIEFAGEAMDGRELLAKLSKDKYDVVVLDISMPGQNGIDVLRQVKSLYPELPVLILSMHPEDQYAVRALRAGAAGYLTKESATDELISAIRKIYKGGNYVSAGLAEKLALDLIVDTSKPPHELLSDREFQVLRMIAGGKTIKDIAAALYLSPKTVSTYRSRVLEKMRMKNNEDLLRYGRHYHLSD
jgi:two-component system, NarL family, invasion response regulator UvrY